MRIADTRNHGAAAEFQASGVPVGEPINFRRTTGRDDAFAADRDRLDERRAGNAREDLAVEQHEIRGGACGCRLGGETRDPENSK